MKRLEMNQMEMIEGASASTSERAGFMCGMTVLATALGGFFTGGAAVIPMIGGMVVPICGASIASMYS